MSFFPNIGEIFRAERMTFAQRHSDVPDAVKEERPDDVYRQSTWNPRDEDEDSTDTDSESED